MNTKKAIYTLATIGIIITSCNCRTEPKPTVNCSQILDKLIRQGSIEPNSNRCIVICDFSSSMDNASVEYVRQTALEVFDCFYGKYTIEYFPVTSASRRPIFQSVALSIKDSSKVSRSRFRQLENCIDSEKSMYRNKLSLTLDTECKNRQRATFLIQSIEHAIDEIRIIDGNQKKKNIVIILSDMRECGSSTMGLYDLDSGDIASYLTMLKTAPSRDDLKALERNIEFRIGYFSKNPPDDLQMAGFWNTMFRKLHYNKAVLFSSHVKTCP